MRGLRNLNQTMAKIITSMSKHSKKKTIFVTKLVSSACLLRLLSSISCCKVGTVRLIECQDNSGLNLSKLAE